MQQQTQSREYKDIDDSDIRLMQQLRLSIMPAHANTSLSPWEYYQASFEQVFGQEKISRK